MASHNAWTSSQGPLSQGRNRSKGVVRVVQWCDTTAIEKDFSSRGKLVRHVLGPWMLDREERALKRLQDLAGIPLFLARPSRTRLLMERLDAKPLNSVETTGAPLPAGFFRRLEALVRRMHQLGVAQGDIGSGDVMILSDGSPGLVDFSVSAVPRPGPLGLPFRIASRHDIWRVARLHQRFAPGDLEPHERRILVRKPAIFRWGRRLRPRAPGAGR
ncbi:MAG: hypothetical protein ACE5ID_09400 [Acidobacteriota bacterium]